MGITWEIATVLGVLAATIVLFITEALRVDIVAVLVLAFLLGTGILTPEEGFDGLSNPATVVVAAMFVLSAGLHRSGALNAVGGLLTRTARRSPTLCLASVLLSIGVISAFINNTAAVAVFLPIMIVVGRESGVGASRFLMPLSFASMLGGVCTLVGTSTNLLVSGIAEKHGLAPLGMFEMTALGIPAFAVGFVYLLTVGTRFIPDRHPADALWKKFEIHDYITDVLVDEGSASIGCAILEAPVIGEDDVDVLTLHRGTKTVFGPARETILESGDVLRVRAGLRDIEKLQEAPGLQILGDHELDDGDLGTDDVALLEAVVSANSRLEGSTVVGTRFQEEFGATVLAIRHRDDLVHSNFRKTRLSSGDVLLLAVRRDRLPELRRRADFVLVNEVETPAFRPAKIIPALAIMAGVVGVATVMDVPVVVTAVIGCVLMVLLRCLEPEEVYDSIDWHVIMLMAGVISLGTALEKTGAAYLLSSQIVALFGAWGPQVVLTIILGLTILLTGVMSNIATAALLAPIGISIAAALGVDSRPFLVAVTFGASVSFLTPVGYKTNLLVYGPGNYRFSDFARVGAPLDLILFGLGAVLIPMIWSFTPS